VSPMASAALLTMASLEIIFFIDVVTAAIAIVTLFVFLKIPVHAKASEVQTSSYLDDFKAGLSYINNHAFLKKFFLFFALFFVLMAPAAFLTPLQVVRSFGEGVWRLTAIEIAFSIGMMVGGGIIASWGGFSNKVHTMTLATIIMGICTIGLGIIPLFWAYLLFMAIFGVSVPIFNTPSTVLIQERVEGDYLGRIFGVFGMIATSMMPIGMLIFGPMADVVKVEWILLATGVFMLLLGLLLGKNKVLLKAGEPVVVPESSDLTL